MSKKIIQNPMLSALLLCRGLGSGGVVQADGYYTIIGPDGRPMVIPQKTEKKETKSTVPSQNVVPESTTHQEASSVTKTRASSSTQPIETKITVPRSLEEKSLTSVVQAQRKLQKLQEEANLQGDTEKSVSQKAIEPIISTVQKNRSSEILSQKQVLALPKANTNEVGKQVVQAESKLTTLRSTTNNSSAIPKAQEGFSKVDGVEYVNNEYLEDQEFNLEGKKRFYSMPDGTGRMETIERKKGVSRSVLDQIFNHSQKAEMPIAFASTYVRLSAEDLAITFENDRCFLKDYKKSVKNLVPQKEVGVWPRKPLKEKFEYELVKLDHSIQYLQIDSYASNNEQPTYYWPLVVFLDGKGCALEGVSGFKNQSIAATFLQHAAIQGVIKVPSQATYMMMTPLASAVDVPEQALSNQGQIRITALK